MTPRRTFAVSILLLSFALFPGCGNDDTLGADSALQAVLRARWSVVMINQARQIVEPLRALPEQFDENDLQDALLDGYDGCASTEAHGDSWTVSIDSTCESNPAPCAGHFDIAPHSTTSSEGKSYDWVAIDGLDLECGDAIIDTGRVVFRSLTVTDTQHHELELKISDFTYSASRPKKDETEEIEETYLAAENFQGHILLRNTQVTAKDGEEMDAVFVAGNASFSDADLDPPWDWGADLQDVVIYQWSGTPRGGTLQLRTLNTNTYNFTTEWMPLTRLSTQPRIRSGKDVWVGCISHDNSNACDPDAERP